MNRARLDEAINRRVTVEEVRHALERDIPPEEREEVLELVRWFTSRYPTAEQRLAYVRQAYARWAAVSRERRPDGDSPD
jgi:hypothetical protein